MSAAFCATCVPPLPMAQPISAAFNAGASLTPSPVIATTSPWARRALTIRTLCSGVTRAYTRQERTARANSFSPILSICAPVRHSPERESMPSFFAVAQAVPAWSPVIITGVIPARRQVLTASYASSRGGSSMPISPQNVSPVSLIFPPFVSPVATAMTLNARSAREALRLSIFSRRAEVSGLFVPFNIISEHFFISTSGAPFATVIILSPSLIATDIIFRSDENGISSVLGFWRLSFAVSVPDRSAAATIAASVGSPDTLPLPSYFASQQSAASEKSFFASSPVS